jgi:hypothetical protein
MRHMRIASNPKIKIPSEADIKAYLISYKIILKNKNPLQPLTYILTHTLFPYFLHPYTYTLGVDTVRRFNFRGQP